MARCNDCNKFVSFEEGDPEVESVEIDSEGNITGQVRIVNVCAECGTEMREATFDVETCAVGDKPGMASEEDIKGHRGEDHELLAEVGDSERTSRQEGKGRGTKTFYGVSVGFTVTCSCGRLETNVNWSDEIQASHMDEV